MPALIGNSVQDLLDVLQEVRDSRPMPIEANASLKSSDLNVERSTQQLKADKSYA